MDNTLIAAIFILAILTYPVFHWLGARHDEKTGVTAFREECEAKGGDPVTISFASTCIMPK